MPNLVSREDDIIFYRYIGDQTSETIDRLAAQTRALCQQLKHEGKPGLLLVDLTELGAQDAGARKASATELDTLPVDKVAVFGANLFMKYLAQFIIRASKRSDITQYFDTKEAATAWLRS